MKAASSRTASLDAAGHRVNLYASFAVGAAIRYALMVSTYAGYIQQRIEVSTPLNSWKRVQEGAFLYRSGINPYQGDMYHENPQLLVATNWLIVYCPRAIPALFVLLDIATAALLYSMAKRFTRDFHTAEQVAVRRSVYRSDTLPIRLGARDLLDTPAFVALVYLFNPYAVLNCVGQTTTVWSNFLLAAFFWALSRRHALLTVVALALETQRNFYPVVLIVPAALVLSEERRVHRWMRAVQIVNAYALALAVLNVTGFWLMRSWSFVGATYGFIFHHDDLQPNIGLFWYFFTEMFEHFRPLFLYTFQLNATLLYLPPLTIRLHRQPVLLAAVLCGVITIFRSYPCVGDVALYVAVLGLWRKAARYMANTFLVLCAAVMASALAPTMSYLWVYPNSGNANFYFGATLALSTAQIFLVTDVLFATNKREFCLRNGMDAIFRMTLK